MPQLTGRVAIVQEGRFQVIDDGGAGHLFILSPHAALETSQLRPLAKAQARVTVSYRDAALVGGMVAERVELARAA